jgi:hypothetical protein
MPACAATLSATASATIIIWMTFIVSPVSGRIYCEPLPGATFAEILRPKHHFCCAALCRSWHFSAEPSVCCHGSCRVQSGRDASRAKPTLVTLFGPSGEYSLRCKIKAADVVRQSLEPDQPGSMPMCLMASADCGEDKNFNRALAASGLGAVLRTAPDRTVIS